MKNFFTITVLLIIALFFGSNIHFYDQSFSLLNLIIFILIPYMIFIMKRKFDKNFMVLLFVLMLFYIIEFAYLILFYNGREHVKDFIYSLHIIILFLFFYIGHRDYGEQFTRLVYKTIFGMLVLLLFIAIVNIVYNIHVPKSANNFNPSLIDNPVPTGLYTNPNDFGVFVFSMLPFLYYYLSNKKLVVNKRIVYLITCVILLLTMSRITFILFCIFPLAILFLKARFKRMLFYTLILAVFYIILTNVNFSYFPNGSVINRSLNRIYSITKIDEQNQRKSSSIYQRILVYKMVAENPKSYIIGKGFNSSPEEMKKIENLEIVNPHSYFIEVIFNFGFIGFIFCSMIFIIPLIYCFKRVKNNELYRYCIVQIFYFMILCNIPSSIMRSSIIWLPMAIALSLVYNKQVGEKIEQYSLIGADKNSLQ